MSFKIHTSEVLDGLSVGDLNILNTASLNRGVAGTIGADATLVSDVIVGTHHVTTLTFTTTSATTAAALSFGAECYTMPAVRSMIMNVEIDGTLTPTAGLIAGDTPEIGVGTIVGTGANATLGAVGATAENIITGTTVPAIGAAGIATVADVVSSAIYMAPASSVIHANIADTFAAVDAGLAFAGTMRIVWIEV